MSNGTQQQLLRTAWPIATVLAWAGSLLWVGEQVGPGGVALGLAASAVVTIPVIGLFLWLDRWNRKPPGLSFSAFVWGASIAAFCSIWSQQWLHLLVDATLGTNVGAWARPLIITPITEEALKALFLIWLLVHRRRQITGVLDAVVFAGLSGAGFSFTENSLYFGRAIMDVVHTAATDDGGDAVATLGVLLFMRVVMVPLFHPLMVALTGVGIGVASNARGQSGRKLSVAAALLVAIVLHGVWDWGGLASTDRYFIFKVYAAALVPIFIAMLVLAIVLRRRAGRTIATTMPALVDNDDVAPEDANQLVDLGARRRWRAAVRQDAGRTAARALGRYQAEASTLALHVARGQANRRRDMETQREAVAGARLAAAHKATSTFSQ